MLVAMHGVAVLRLLHQPVKLRAEVGSPTPVAFAECDDTCAADRDHRGLADNPQVGEHRSHRLRGNHVRVSVFSDVLFQGVRALVEGNEVKVNLSSVFRNYWAQRP